ncbi:MAG TPA: BadF/BadG/BcrA/BcrD ATPase family protein [Rubrivivax sp.]|jgi:N-acetylglucosamine kinase-like BadF-type ATPase|nr:BadF/BadG/BcrA/BcrD ATPase family protein [Rubrivivax sp.]
MTKQDEQTSLPGLGLDAGGTQTRWALADRGGALLAQGTAGGMSGLQLDNAAGRAAMAATLQQIAQATGPVRAVVAGVTGFDTTQQAAMGAMLAAALHLHGESAQAVRAMNDIELACHAAFAPGAGYVVYAGTGSVAAFVDEQGELHRAGGRGTLIDDAGGGHWIAREALRRVWRAEDHAPGAWQHSVLARKVFAHIGGSDWAQTRQWAYNASRGELGVLALAVADAAAEQDADALALLHDAGAELARLALALLGRLGPRPLALAGRVFLLHPTIEAALRSALPADCVITRSQEAPHLAAARLAAQAALTTAGAQP